MPCGFNDYAFKLTCDNAFRTHGIPNSAIPSILSL
jgi:hypothetical protein